MVDGQQQHAILSGTSASSLPSLCLPLQKLEGRVASDQDLKLSDMLRYYTRDSQAAKVRGGPRAELGPGGRWDWGGRAGR